MGQTGRTGQCGLLIYFLCDILRPHPVVLYLVLPGDEKSVAVLQADGDRGVVAEVGQRGLSAGLHGRRIDPLPRSQLCIKGSPKVITSGLQTSSQ